MSKKRGKKLARNASPSKPPGGPAHSLAPCSRAVEPLVRRIVRMRLRGNRAKSDFADDVVQETLIRLWRWPPRVETPQELERWVHRVARSAISDVSKSARSNAGWIDDYEPSEDRRRQRLDPRINAMKESLEELPMRSQRILELHHMHSRSCAEVAAELRITVSAVWADGSRSRGKLRVMIEERMR